MAKHKKERALSHAVIHAVEEDGKKVPALTEFYDDGSQESYTYRPEEGEDAGRHVSKLLRGHPMDFEDESQAPDYQSYKKARAKEIAGN